MISKTAGRFFILISVFFSSAQVIAADSDIRQALDMSAAKGLSFYAQPIHAIDTLRHFYVQRNYLPAWSGKQHRAVLDELVSAVAGASVQGLLPADYHQAALKQAITEQNTLATELLATDAYLTLAAHILGGRLNPETIETDWTANRRERNLVEHLEHALSVAEIQKSLLELEPDAPAYAILKKALVTYRDAAHEGGWESLAEGKPLKTGDSGPRVTALSNRLHATGLLTGNAGPEVIFDAVMEKAVADFQRRIGLEPDGVVGAVTLRELNKSPAQRIDQIRANLERWRWLPEQLGSTHIRVNIAGYGLDAYVDNKIVSSHDVIVGRTYRKTPVFSGEISYVVFNPWWETPDSLARLDKLPAFRKDPGVIKKLGFEILDRQGNAVNPDTVNWNSYSNSHFPFRLRQRPGPQNALGQVKIMFPNKHNVYLHDTPTRLLFSKTERAFSSGCVRVSNVIDLTQWLLGDTPGWDRQKIDSQLAGTGEIRVNLKNKIPVHILYFTAAVSEDGELRLLNDIYQRDEILIKALSGTRSVH